MHSRYVSHKKDDPGFCPAQERGGEGNQARQDLDNGDQYLEPALRVSRLETRSLAAEVDCMEVR